MPVCNDYGDPDVPGCQKNHDERYTMDYGELGKIYWCAHCGPRAHEMEKALLEALQTRPPEFAKEVEEAIEEIASRNPKH